MQIKQFTPIFKEILKEGDSFPFKIYKELEDHSFLPVLLNGNTLNNLQEFLKIPILYIKSDDKDKYQLFIEEHTTKILNNPNIPIDDKTSFINQVATNIMNTLFEEKISMKNIKKANAISDNIVNLMLNDNQAIYSMLKVTSYDYHTYSHCVDVASYAIAFGVYLGLSKDELATLGKAAMLHDVGKKDINKSIITKNGPLTFEEYELVKNHSMLGVKALRLTGVTNKTLLTIVEQHHEKCDGSGYPKGLKDEDIHDFAKILTICDIFDALTTKRTYKNRMHTYDALSIMFTEMNNQLSKKYLKDFAIFMQGEGAKIKSHKENN